MHKLIAPLRWIKLYNPVYIGNIDASCGQICRQKNRTGLLGISTVSILLQLLLPKLLVNLRPLLLSYLPMEFRD